MIVDGIEYEVKSMPNKVARVSYIQSVPTDGILEFKEHIEIHREKLLVEEVDISLQTTEEAEKVSELVFHDSIREVLKFSPLRYLKKLKFGRNVIHYPKFYFLKYLESVVFHPFNKIKTLYNSNFKGCWALKEISLPFGLEIIDPSCFEECYGLERIILPADIHLIGSRAFSHCNNLRDVIFIGGKPEFRPGIFNGCGKVKRTAYVRSDMVNYFKETKNNPFHKILPLSLRPTYNLRYKELGKTQIQLVPEIHPEKSDTCQYRNEERGYILVPEFKYIQGEKKKVKLHPLAFYNCQEPITVMLPKSMKNKHGLVLDNKVTLDWY